MNNVQLVGRMTRDPETRWTTGNNQMCIARFTLAVDRRFKKDGDQQTADFISCKAFGKTAEFIEKYFNKGRRIGVVGRIETGSYEKDGNKVYYTEVIVEQAEFVDNKSDASNNTETSFNNNDSKPSTPVDQFINVPDEIQEELPFT